MPIDYFDYTLLQKKGLLKIKEQPKEDNIKIDNRGFVDFTNASQTSSSSTADSAAPTAPSGDMFGFLDSMASVGASNPSPSASVYGSSSSNADSEIATLKVKLDDTQYKLDRLIERLERIESKLSGGI